MLTPHDELLCHQLSTTFDHVQQSDLRWTERIVLYGFDTSGSVNIMTGLARYPNRNVIDAYAMITVDDKVAHVVRLSREITGQQDGLGSWEVGPYRYEVVEPLRKVRATLDDNEHGIRMRLDFEGEFPAYEQEPAFFRSRGRVREDARRYYQNGRISGWVEIEGRRIDIDPDNWWFGRDHSWGTRHGGGGGSLSEGEGMQPAELPDGVLYYMGIFQFDDELVHFAQRETADGERWHFEGHVLPPIDSAAQPIPIIDVKHDLEFREDFRIIKGGTFVAQCADGTDREFTLSRVTNYWPGLAGYDVYRGYGSGLWRGPYWSDGFTADLTDTADLQKVSALSGTLCRVEHAGKVGYGLVEMVFYGRNARYGYAG
ncbi:DUF7065 domain-containing protein [Nocardia huaxiensis]|uniref:DUF7065 domain-containing protein n=1 Tax=Nocardia huaxiensis TaxID=2755382 RepID=A0A7D6ZDU5_9NOCA|nr:hypothetical protein [Nocardia huaxiensis]QLY31318.1 hypothetical protein H0264_02840 [Nocardia huaxiensis]UFS94861.1 hypothetical protein LPY97_29675 [Nocardia huaxiensis]